VIVAVVLLATATSALLTLRATPQYASQVTLFVSAHGDVRDASSAYQGSLLSQQKVKSYTELLRGERVARAVVQKLRLDLTAKQLAGKITTGAVPDTVLLTVAVIDASPARAQLIAAAVADEFVKLVPVLEGSPDGERPAVTVTVVEPADRPSSPVSPQPVRNLAVALALGLLGGVGLAVARESLDTTIKTTEQLQEVTGAPSLGVVAFDSAVPKHPLIVHDGPYGRRVEAFRKIRTNFQFVDVDQSHKVVLVTSSVPGEGKTTTVCNLAITIAEAGKRVLLIDGDLRRSRAASYLGLPRGVGLTSVLVGRAQPDDAIQIWGDNLFAVLASGPIPPNPSELLGSRQMHHLVKELRDRYDVVLVDTPPLLPVADAAATAAACDGAVVVVRHGKTRREQLHNAVSALRTVEVPILGTVLSMAPARRHQAYYYDYEGYGPMEHRGGEKPVTNAPVSAAVQAPGQDSGRE